MAAEKQIAAARAHEVAMAAMRADRQILEEHLVFEATVDTATRLSTLKYSSCCFLEATTSAF
jgi:hypothetical protein